MRSAGYLPAPAGTTILTLTSDDVADSMALSPRPTLDLTRPAFVSPTALACESSSSVVHSKFTTASARTGALDAMTGPPTAFAA